MTNLNCQIIIKITSYKVLPMEAPIAIREISKNVQGNDVKCTLYENSIFIQIANKDLTGSTYYTDISQDTMEMHQELKQSFESLQQIMDHIAGHTPKNCRFEVTKTFQLIIIVFCNGQLRKINIALTQKKVSKSQLLLEQTVDTLRKEVDRLKKIEEEYLKLIANKGERQTIVDQNSYIKENSVQRAQIVKLQKKLSSNSIGNQKQKKLQMKIVQLESENSKKKSEIQQLEKENAQLKGSVLQLSIAVSNMNNTITQLTAQNNSRQLTIKDMNQKISKASQIFKMPEDQKVIVREPKIISNPQGQILVFKTQPNSVNFSCFEFNNNKLTKNASSVSGQGRLFPCLNPVPKNGRYFYKLRLLTTTNPPNIRLGFIGKDVTKQQYLNCGDQTGLMYYCYSKTKEVIHEGNKRVQGFSINSYDTLIVVIDKDKKTVEWHVEGQLKKINPFPEMLKDAEKIYFFVQLWINGDQIEMLSA